MPPLPHHRAYGSVPRRFGGLSAHQLLHGDQAETTEASFGEGAMQSFREAQPPGTLGAENGRTGRPFGDLEPTDPAIQRWQLVPLAEAEVAGPTPYERVQVGDHLLQADAPVPPSPFTNPIFKPGHGLVGDAPPERRVIRDREAKERAVPRSGDGTLLRVDLQFEASFDKEGQALHDPPAGLFAADVDVTVIRVPHEPVAATLKFAIQFIQHEIREQGREWTALRGPFSAFLEQPAIEHTSRQVSPDEPKNPPIRNPRRYACHQPVVIDPVKELCQVDIHDKP